MTLTPIEIAQAAIDSAFEMLSAQGLSAESGKLMKELRTALDARENLVTATLITPTGDAGPLAQTIKSALEKKLGHPVALRQKADKTLLGGSILEYGDMRIDTSMRGALEQAKNQLEQSNLS